MSTSLTYASNFADEASLIAADPDGRGFMTGHSYGRVDAARLFAFAVKLRWSAADVARFHDVAVRPMPPTLERHRAVQPASLVDPESEGGRALVEQVPGRYHARSA